MANIQTIDGKIREFKSFIDEFSKLFNDGHLSYNMFQSQHARLKQINIRQEEANLEAEDRGRLIEMENQRLKVQGQKEFAAAREVTIKMREKAVAQLKEVERLLSDAEQKRIKKAIAEMEVVAEEVAA